MAGRNNYPPGKGPAGNAHKPTQTTRDTVAYYAAQGMRKPVIAQKLGIHRDTLVRHYRAELDLAKAEGLSAVFAALRRNMIQTRSPAASNAAAELLLKYEFGQSPDTAAMREVMMRLSKLDDMVKRRLAEQIVEKAETADGNWDMNAAIDQLLIEDAETVDCEGKTNGAIQH